MKLRTNKEIREFKAAIDRCKETVFLVSPDGEQYDLKSETGYYLGIAKMLTDEKDQMELYTNDYSDETVMMDFYFKHCA